MPPKTITYLTYFFSYFILFYFKFQLKIMLNQMILNILNKSGMWFMEGCTDNSNNSNGISTIFTKYTTKQIDCSIIYLFIYLLCCTHINFICVFVLLYYSK